MRGDGYAFAVANDNNDAGTTIGSSSRYVDIAVLGFRAVRWDAGSTVATELGNLGTDTNGETTSGATDINEAGIVVG